MVMVFEDRVLVVLLFKVSSRGLCDNFWFTFDSSLPLFSFEALVDPLIALLTMLVNELILVVLACGS
jgi:hypothetical protein